MADIKFEQYLILYDYERIFRTNNAVSLKDCLVQYLDYTGNNRPLLRKALNGMETEQEMIELINAMTTYTIEHIFKIDKVVYEAKSQ